MIDRRTILAAALAGVAGTAATASALAQAAVSRITALFRFPRSRAAISGSRIMPAARFWWSIRRRYAATPHNMPGCRNFGRSFTAEA